MNARIVVLGAGFGGLELATTLSEAPGVKADITLIDRSDAFVFGFSKLDVMFGKHTLEAVRHPYSKFSSPGVRLLRETVTAIDPATRRVTTNAGTHDADVLVLALGADYDWTATPGITEGVNEFYSVTGANRMRSVVAAFRKGKAVIGLADAPFKCPPAPSETALLLHDDLVKKGVRQDCEITLVFPLGSPVPPSPATSQALLAAFAERDIRFIPGKRVIAVDATAKEVRLDDGTALPYDLFLGVPKHHAPDVVRNSGLADGDWVKVDPTTLGTKFPDVYAIGDVANQGTPKAGVFAEGAGGALARSLIARLTGNGAPGVHTRQGSCWIEFGADRVARVNVDFSGPQPTGTFDGPSTGMREQKNAFGSTRAARWFSAR